MGRLRNWFNGLSIRKKMVAAIYGVLIPVQFVLFVFIYNYNYSHQIGEKNREINQALIAAADSIDEKLNSGRQVISYVMLDSDMDRLLHRKDVENLNTNSRFWYDISPMGFISEMSFTDGYVKTIGIYPENGLIPFVYSSDHTSCLDAEDVLSSSIYKECCLDTRGYVIKRMKKGESEIYSYSADDKIVVCREVFSLNGKDKRFFAVVGLTSEGLDAYMGSLRGYDNDFVYLENADGDLLAESEGCNEEILADFTDENSSEGSGAEPVRWKDYYVYSQKVGDTGATLRRAIPRSVIHDIAANIFGASLLLSLGVLVAVIPLLIMVSRLIIDPLDVLRESMVKFRNGDFSQRIEVKTDDEIGETQQGFNEMVSEMKELIDKNYVITLKEKESELNALQAQINPHFLYNALDALYWKCMETGNEEIGEDVLALSDLFRLVLNTGRDITFVSDEIKLLASYLHMQQLRFGNRFVYNIDVEESLMDEILPKLLLQPFVENSVVHGFEKDTGNFTLDIIGKREGDRMILEVIDTGVGMDDQQVAELFAPPKTGKTSGHRVSKYAIRNVKERLDLLYKESYRLDISSKPGEGTTVRIEIPLSLKEG